MTRENYSDKKTLVEYISSNKERIKIVSGLISRKVLLDKYSTGRGRNVVRTFFSTRIYVNSRLLTEYLEDDLPEKCLLQIEPELKKLAEAKADSEELFRNLEGMLSNLAEQEQTEKDDKTRGEELADLQERLANLGLD